MTFYDTIAKGEAYGVGREDLAPPYSSWNKIMEAYELIKEIVVVVNTRNGRVRRLDQIKWSTSYKYWSSRGISQRKLLVEAAKVKILRYIHNN